MPLDSSTLLICDRQSSVILGYRRGQARNLVTYDAYGLTRPQAVGPVVGFNGQRIEPGRSGATCTLLPDSARHSAHVSLRAVACIPSITSSMIAWAMSPR